MPRPDRHVIVDGSNIATEGRSLPSLTQLDEAVQAFQSDNPDASVTVVVDATFAHRIAKKERKTFDAAVDAGEIIVPPAGAIGRGDAFILQVAAKGDAEVLSNDSFQEFHGEHKWLFDEGRLIGAKPVDGIGWVFVDRVPVRGPESRRATRKSASQKSTKRGGSRSSSDSKAKPQRSKSESKSKSEKPQPEAGDGSKSKSKSAGRQSRKSTAAASSRSKKSGGDEKSTDKSSRSSKKKELNSPSEFLGFVTKHSIGDAVRGTVERFSSHGCYVRVSDAQCYLPVKAMGDPPPSKARDLVSAGGQVEVRVESLDADRRGINVELIQVLDSSGPSAQRRGKGKQTQPSQQSTAVADGSAREANPTRSKTNVASKSTKKPAKKSAAKKSTKKAPAKKTAAKKSTKKAPARKSAVKKATKKAPAKKSTAKKSAKKAPAKKTAAKKSTKKAPAKKSAKKAPAKKSAAKKSTKKAPAKKAAAKKAPAKKSAKKTPAKATASKRAQRASAKKTTKKAPARKAAAKKAAKKASKKAPAKAAAKKSVKKTAKKAAKRSRRR